MALQVLPGLEPSQLRSALSGHRCYRRHLPPFRFTDHRSLAAILSPLATYHPPPTDPPKLASFACPIPPWFVLSCNLPETNTRAIWLCSDAFLSPTAPSLQIHCSLATGRSPPEPPSAGTSEVRSCADLPRLLSDTVPALPKTERGPITPTKPHFIIRRGGDSDGQITPFLETGSAPPVTLHSPACYPFSCGRGG